MLIYLTLIVIILATVHSFELAAVYADGSLTQHARIAEELNIQPEHCLQRHYMYFSKIGNGMIIWLQVLKQPLEFIVA